MQRAIRAIFPAHCLACGTLVIDDGGLCGPCWRDTPFIIGLVCDKCGTPLPGFGDGHTVLCDDCMTIPRPWDRGRAALLYRGQARRMVLALKHADRTDIAAPAARWMLKAARDIVAPSMVAVPIPSHWTRLVRRRYTQSALLANEFAHFAGIDLVSDALIRARFTQLQDGKGRDARFANLAGAIQPHPRRGAALAGRDVLLVDDVMTSGATLAAATRACHAAGARRVSTVTLARVAKDT